MEFPLEAQIICTDGDFGQLVTVIVNPKTETVTNIAVKADEASHMQYLVSVDCITDITDTAIKLNCTLEDVSKMPPFTETEFIEVPMSYYGDPLGAYDYNMYGSEMVPVDHELLPEGQIGVSRGMWVEATDGHIGRVDELIVHPESRKITHFVMRQGHLWGEKEVTIPLSLIDRTEFETIYLNVPKQEIETMPAMQIRRHYSKKEVDVMSVEILIFTFNQADTAEKAAQTLKELAKDKSLEIRNAAIIVKDAEGKTSHKEAEDIGSKRGALFGAITGGLIGLLGGPVGAIVGATAGAATGGVAARKIDLGFSDEYLNELQQKLQPNTSALVTLVEQASSQKVIEALAEFEGELLKQAITGDIAAQITAGNEAEDA